MKTDTEYKKATLAHKEGRLAEAEKAYLEVLKEKPDSGPVLNALGTLFLDWSKPDKARELFEKAANLNPPDLTACYNLGRLKQLENDYAGAIDIYRAIVDQQPRLGLVWNNFGNLDPIIRSASSYLDQAGIIAFSVEKLEDDSSTGYQLFPSGRYAHSQAYIENCLKNHGLEPIHETESVIRKQSENEVKGLLIVAKKG